MINSIPNPAIDACVNQDCSSPLEKNTLLLTSQAGGPSVITYCYTDSPWRLLTYDIYYFFKFSWALPWIVMPLRATEPSDLHELAPTWANARCMCVHAVLAVLQLAFLISIPLAAVLVPAWMAVTGAAAFMALNHALCSLLNGDGIEFHSEPAYAEPRPEHAHEQWVFVNGVAAGEHWMRCNLNRLALTFKRPVIGIHNRTSGILFDVVECLVQRNFGYATADVRACYRILKRTLHDPRLSRLVLILHSQGGIQGGLALDWLLQELPQDLLRKLEVYTFGSAANHFNNPHRHVESLRRIRDHPLAAHDRAIRHVEHYAHATDFVAVWGVLHFVRRVGASRAIPRFIGRVFVRASDRGGHQFCQHYLDGMFPLVRDPVTGEPTGVAEVNDFVDSEIEVAANGDEREAVCEAFIIGYLGAGSKGGDGRGGADVACDVRTYGLHESEAKLRVRDVSRLWMYRNGRVPPELPPLLTSEFGLARMATL